jgi:hypothetical protein
LSGDEKIALNIRRRGTISREEEKEEEEETQS